MEDEDGPGGDEERKDEDGEDEEREVEDGEGEDREDVGSTQRFLLKTPATFRTRQPSEVSVSPM